VVDEVRATILNEHAAHLGERWPFGKVRHDDLAEDAVHGSVREGKRFRTSLHDRKAQLPARHETLVIDIEADSAAPVIPESAEPNASAAPHVDHAVAGKKIHRSSIIQNVVLPTQPG
jgi:hypothetical protein